MKLHVLTILILIRESFALSNLNGCENNGVVLSNGKCQCKPYTSGRQCEKIDCQSWSILTDDESHCHCPPGYSSKFCEQSGARPLVEAEFDSKKRTFIVVISMNPSYDSFRQVIGENLEATINALQANEPGYIDSYIGMLVLGVGPGGIMTNSITTRNVTEFVEYIRSKQIITERDWDGAQPILNAVNRALSSSEMMRSHPVVLVFTNREDNNSIRPSEAIDDPSQETKLRQIALSWHAKIYFFINKDLENALDFTSNGYDAYRRIATATHGDLITHKPNELAMIMKSFIPRLYKQELKAVMSYAPVSLVVMDVNRDFVNQTVTVTVSIDQHQVQDIDSTTIVMYLRNGKVARMPDNDLSLQFLKVFTLPPDWNSFSLYCYANLTVSVRTFVSSDLTFFLSHSPNRQMDNGRPNLLAEYGSYMHARPINIGTSTVILEQRQSSKTALAMYEANYGQRRMAGDWNMNYEFTSVQNCTPGAYTQKFMIQQSQAVNIVRLYPGYCFNAVKHQIVTLPPPTFPTILASNDSCYQKNWNAVYDARSFEFRQIMFAVELSAGMNESMSSIKELMKSIVSYLDNDVVDRQYTLIFFNDYGAFAAVSTYSAADFKESISEEIEKAQNLIMGTATVFRSLDAVYMASKLILESPAQVNVFTTGKPALADIRILPRNLQVNWLYISHEESIPSSTNMKLLEKQGGGRTIVATPTDITDLVSVIVSAIYQNNIVVDNALENCSHTSSFAFFMEKDAMKMTFTLSGRNISIIRVDDADNKTIEFSKYSNVIFANSASQVVDLYNNENITGRLLTLYFTTSTGGCSVQARTNSHIGFALGFSSDPNADFVAGQPISRRGDGKEASYIMVKVSDSSLYSIDKVVVSEEDVDQSWKSPQEKVTSFFSPRDSNTCAYQYRSTPIEFPMVDFIRVAVSATFMKNTKIERVFFYYTPSDKTGDPCNNGEPNAAGQCQCSPNYTGGLCDQPVCQNGGINSNGVCDCADSGFYGTFCEYVVRDSSQGGTVSSTTTPIPPITRKAPVTVPNRTSNPTPKSPNAVSRSGAAATILFIFTFIL